MTPPFPLPAILPYISLRDEFDDWALLFNPDTGRAVGLNPTGVTIFKSLVAGLDLQEIINALLDEFEPVPADPSEDIRLFCEQIVRLGYATA